MTAIEDRSTRHSSLAWIWIRWLPAFGLSGVVVLAGTWITWRKLEGERQRTACFEILDLGGKVGKDYEVDAKGELLLDAQPRQPQWLRELLGPDFFDTPVMFDPESRSQSFYPRSLHRDPRREFDARLLGPLKKLRGIRYVALAEHSIDDTVLMHI